MIEQIGSARTKIDDLWATISVLFQSCTSEAVEGITHSFSTTNDTLVLIVAEGALIADAHESGRSNIRVADWTLAVAFVAESTDGDACCLATHDEIWVMTRHFANEELGLVCGLVLTLKRSGGFVSLLCL